jgi:hypothetical protein
MPGAGLFPAGFGPFGGGTVSVEPGKGRVFLDAQGLQRSCRSINVETGDYEVSDENGRLLGATTAQQMVTLAIRTTRGSAADQSLGQGVLDIRQFTDNWDARTIEDVKRALQSAESQGVLSVVSVETERQGTGGFAGIRVVWRDAETGNLEEQTFG